MTFRIKNEDCRPHANDLEKSLTSMDWLPRLNVRAISQAANQETGVNGRNNLSYATIRDVADETSRGGKPPFSYANLITLAINSSTSNKMTLSEIYVWIAEKFPFYKSAGTGWKNSIRHNLSLNKCFAKVPRSKDDPGKGSYWSVVSNPTPDDALAGNSRGTKRKRYPNTFQINAPTAQNPPPPPQSDALFFNSLQQNNSNDHHHREDEEKYSYPFKRQTTPTSTTSNDSGSSCSTVNHNSNQATDRPDSSSSSSNGLSHLDLVDLSESFKSIYQQILEQASRVPVHSADEPQSSSGMHATTLPGCTTSKGELQAIKTENEADSSSYQQQHSAKSPPSGAPLREYMSPITSSSSSSHQYVGANDAMLTSGHQHEHQHMTLNEINKSLTSSADLSSAALQGFEGYNSSIDSLRQSCNKLKSFDLSGIDLSQFQDLFDNMQQAEENDWNVDADLAVDLCSSLNRFVNTHHVTPTDHVTSASSPPPRQPPPPYDHPRHMIQTAHADHPVPSSVATGSSEPKGSSSHQHHQQYLPPQCYSSGSPQQQMVDDRRVKTAPIPSAQPPQFQNHNHHNQHHHNDSEDFYDSFDWDSIC